MQLKLTKHELEDLLLNHLKDTFPGYRICDDGVSIGSYDGSATIELEKAEPKAEPEIDWRAEGVPSAPPPSDYDPQI